MLGLFVWLATPATYYFVSTEHQKTEATYLSLEVSRKLKETVRLNPELWEYAVVKFLKVFDEAETSKIYRIRIFDRQDRLLEHQDFDPVPWLWTTGTSDIVYNHVRYGRVEVDQRSDNLLLTSLVLGGLFFVAGIAVALVVYFYPTSIVRRSEDELVRSLDRLEHEGKEKEVLLLEIHHRVKNSLQLITSMIGLKVRRTTNAEAKELLENVRFKIHTIASVHEQLYQGPTVGTIGMQRYLETLLNEKPDALGDLMIPITYQIRAGGLLLPLHAAMPIGLIVSELVMNCLKYAFVGRTSGRIEVELASKDDLWRLTVRDDGVGMDAAKMGEADRKLGFILIQSLAGQLGGTLKIESSSGTTVCIEGIRFAQTP